MDISSMLEVEVQEVAESKENVTPTQKTQSTFSCQNFSKEENDFYKLTYGSDVASVRFLRLHCTGCDEHIGSAPAEKHNMTEHPVLRTLLCAKCREFYGDGTFEQGDDATDMFCRWCANGGNLYCCSYCSNTFCSKCIKRNFDPPTIKRIEAEDSWKCFVCDPKDLFPLRSITRALMTHIETVTKILENDRRMGPKEVEEKMHLDETKCCSRKRKRRRRRTLSNSDDDEEEDVNYVPENERPDTPPSKKRKIRRQWTQVNDRNGYMDHEYYNNKQTTKVEPDIDPADLLIPCEQTMIEGDTEIINPNDSETPGEMPNKEVSSPQVRPQIVRQVPVSVNAQKQTYQQMGSNNSMAINTVPLANLLKVALSSGAKKIKVTHTANQKLVAVPVSAMPKSVASSNITFVKPATHFLVPKNIAKNMQVSAQQQQQLVTTPQQNQPNVIDLDSDDEPAVVGNFSNNKIKSYTRNINTDQSKNSGDTYAVETIDSNGEDDEPMVISTSPRTSVSRSRGTNRNTDDLPNSMSDMVPITIQHRDQRFKKMLILQSQEIDNALGELKTKILKLVQMSNMKSQEADLLNSAAQCTKRFHRAIRKTLVELSQINDRVVRDYVHWKKKNGKIPTLESQEKGNEEKTKDKSRYKPQSSDHDLTLEMTCVRESASESESDDDDSVNAADYSMEAVNVPSEFSQILDHLTIFKRKPTALKAVGDSSVVTEDKACQAYDVPWRDYEKCIGYSLLTRSEYDPKSQKETLRPVVVPDENFGKYQEQYLFYLQHIEDFGIETDELKGLPDPNHIPLKDLIDGTSPFIMDMLERLSPVTLSNGCSSPPSQHENAAENPDATSETTNNFHSSPLAVAMDISSSPPSNSNNENENENSETLPTTAIITSTEAIATDDQETEKSSDDNVATSKAVEELVKMVTKLSEDLRNENNANANAAIAEIEDICTVTSNNDECTSMD
ncbi:uncharacterized protein LOC100679538 isoform X1 [Nasonia vitripennis]|uniref:PHD-type domain-containing protein n=2 Tax=Nasonia vitripennis TaxID=7425 RepID=A0A7M7GBA2_NASVI|nr:uncharacterized protein LOC100679538 isoform X1 [Nasonia vitripennis]